MTVHPVPTRNPPGRLVGLGFAAIAASALAGCGVDYASSEPVLGADYHQRHAIALVNGPTNLDVYSKGGAIDAISVAKIREFADKYKHGGTGEILIMTPGGRGQDAKAVYEIRKTLAAAGLHGMVAVSSYSAPGDGAASPIRLAFVGTKATVKSPCGQWPSDIASASSLEGWKNESYWNFGCATQATLAAQVEEPRDFVQARASDAPDVAMRLRAIGSVRKGADPGTGWSTSLTPIGGGG